MLKVPPGTVPGWMRLLANYPGAGLRTATAFVATGKEFGSLYAAAGPDRLGDRPPGSHLVRLGDARKALKALGQTEAQIADLDGDLSAVPTGTAAYCPLPAIWRPRPSC